MYQGGDGFAVKPTAFNVNNADRHAHDGQHPGACWVSGVPVIHAKAGASREWHANYIIQVGQTAM